MFFMEIINGLEKYGLSYREAIVYKELLVLGLATASEVSKRTKILRQTTYEIIDKLLEKGLISFVIKNHVKHFEATDPKRFNELLTEKKEAIDNVLFEMEQLRAGQTKKPLVETYEGIEGLKTIYGKMIRDNPRELFEIGNTASFSEILKLYFIENYMQKRIQNKTKLKLITDISGKDLFSTNKKQFRETRFSKKLDGVKTATYLYEDVVIIITFDNQPMGVLIQNQLIADTQKIQFESLWNESRN
jgi:sugar-specific transcriptional regulator TrmB